MKQTASVASPINRVAGGNINTTNDRFGGPATRRPQTGFAVNPEPTPPKMIEEVLPFTVRLVGDDDDLNKAVKIRHSAYSRHLPLFAETLRVLLIDGDPQDAGSAT